jgi:hypothetical protein
MTEPSYWLGDARARARAMGMDCVPPARNSSGGRGETEGDERDQDGEAGGGRKRGEEGRRETHETWRKQGNMERRGGQAMQAGGGGRVMGIECGGSCTGCSSEKGGQTVKREAHDKADDTREGPERVPGGGGRLRWTYNMSQRPFFNGQPRWRWDMDLW